MRHVVVELAVVEQNRMVCMVELEKMFKGSGLLLVFCLNIVNVYRFDINS